MRPTQDWRHYCSITDPSPLRCVSWGVNLSLGGMENAHTPISTYLCSCGQPKSNSLLTKLYSSANFPFVWSGINRCLPVSPRKVGSILSNNSQTTMVVKQCLTARCNSVLKSALRMSVQTTSLCCLVLCNCTRMHLIHYQCEFCPSPGNKPITDTPYWKAFTILLNPKGKQKTIHQPWLVSGMTGGT